MSESSADEASSSSRFETEPTECRSCGLPVYWALTENKKSAIIYAREVPDETYDGEGNVHLEEEYVGKGYRVLRAYHKKQDELLDDREYVFVDHHTNCPQADYWTERAKRKKEGE